MTHLRQSDSEAVRPLQRLMEDTFQGWRTVPASQLTIAEQEARKFLLERKQ